MALLTEEIRAVCESNHGYFATASMDGKPNVVPVGLVKAMDDDRLLIVDVLFNKTRKNLQANKRVALAVTDMRRLMGIQLKGRMEIVTEGPLFEKSHEIMVQKAKEREELAGRLLSGNPELKEKIQRMQSFHQRLKPRAVVVMTVEEVYSTMKG